MVGRRVSLSEQKMKAQHICLMRAKQANPARKMAVGRYSSAIPNNPILKFQTKVWALAFNEEQSSIKRAEGAGLATNMAKAIVGANRRPVKRERARRQAEARRNT